MRICVIRTVDTELVVIMKDRSLSAAHFNEIVDSSGRTEVSHGFILMLKSVMENSRCEHHVMDLTCLHLDYGSKSNDLIHGHAELLGSCVILVVESVLHVVKESSDDGFRACIDVEIISIGIEIAGEDEVSAILDLDL